MESFQGTKIAYKPLEGNEIRLVKLKPAQCAVGGRDNMIEVELFHAPLDGTTKFYALSYVWGDAAKTRDIFVDGGRFPVTLNLWNALHRILARPGTTLFGGEESVCRSPHKEGSSATEEGSGETWLAVTTSLWTPSASTNHP
ncbi:hypothetical protein RB601_003520 [Gaeumannomyces tritici]